VNGPLLLRGALPAARCGAWRSAFDPPQPGPRHRTHLTAAMTQARTSLELRFFGAGAPHPRLGAGPTILLR
jgi:hypothetical protein